MTTTLLDVSTQKPMGFKEAISLQAVELDRTIDFLATLDGDAWATQTDCPDWDVRQMYLHVLGACEAGASMKENVHQMLAGRKHRKQNGGSLEGGLSHVQVKERIELSPTQLQERLASVAPATSRNRGRTPAPMRQVRLKIDGPVYEKWALGYLLGVIYLRDLWMHRVDAAHVTGRELALTAEHDGRIVADVVAEWARRHGEPFTLNLSGPAGGSFTSGDTGASEQSLDLDAIEFCRLLAGRGEATGLLTTVVPF